MAPVHGGPGRPGGPGRSGGTGGRPGGPPASKHMTPKPRRTPAAAPKPGRNPAPAPNRGPAPAPGRGPGPSRGPERRPAPPPRPVPPPPPRPVAPPPRRRQTPPPPSGRGILESLIIGSALAGATASRTADEVDPVCQDTVETDTAEAAECPAECPNCGAPTDGSRYCEYCRSRLY